jgi:hypothetical protein
MAVNCKRKLATHTAESCRKDRNSKMPAIIDAVYAENMSLRSLRDELLQHHSSINYRESPDADWGSDVVGDVGIVVYAEDRRRPASCLGHELLHLKLQAQGYRRIRCGVSNFAESNWLRQFLTAMDNELQHQRMFDQFLAMGFRSEQFYGSAETAVQPKTFVPSFAITWASSPPVER